MKVTQVKVFSVDNQDRLKAYASVVFDNCFIVRDLRIIQGNKGLFVAMPSKKGRDGRYSDIAHPLNQQTRDMIEESVLKAYQEATTGQKDTVEE